MVLATLYNPSNMKNLPCGEPYINQRTSDYSERFTFTGNDPRKGWRIPLNEIKYNEQRDEEKERSRGPFASERGDEPRSGIPYCSVYSYTYFGARYMDYELMAMWLSVDPMADKYPSISPYAYCAWNPVKLVDPDGREMFPTESAAAKVRANAVDMFGESRVGEIYNKGDEKHPNYAFLVYDYGKDKYERSSSKGVWAYKPDKCVDSKFDLFLYATFKAEKEWSFNGSFSIGGQCGVDVGCVNLGINISSIDLVGIDWDWGKGKVDTYHCEENNARGTRGVSLGLFTVAGQTYEGGDYIDEASKRTNVLGVGVGQSKGQWNITSGVTAILGILISISSKIKK